MSSVRLVFSSDHDLARGESGSADERIDGDAPVERLSELESGTSGTIVAVSRDDASRMDRLLALGVTPGAHVTVLQTFPGIVFMCDQTELAVERTVAHAIIVRRQGDVR